MSIVFLMFGAIHWTFTFHYLRVAALFKMLFKSHTVTRLETMKKRRHNLRIVNFAAYIILVIGLVIFTTDILGSSWLIIWDLYWSLASTAMTIICLGSIWRLSSYTVYLKSLGVFANQRLMKLYLFAWITSMLGSWI